MTRKKLTVTLTLAFIFFLAIGAHAGSIVIGLELGNTSRADAIAMVEGDGGTILKEQREASFDYVVIRGYPLTDAGTIETLLIFDTEGILCGVHRRVLEDSIFTHLLTFGAQFRLVSMTENSLSAISKDNVAWFKSKGVKYKMDLDGQKEAVFDLGDAAARMATSSDGFGTIEITLKDTLAKFADSMTKN